MDKLSFIVVLVVFTTFSLAEPQYANSSTAPEVWSDLLIDYTLRLVILCAFYEVFTDELYLPVSRQIEWEDSRNSI